MSIGIYNHPLVIRRAIFTYISFVTNFYIFPVIALTELTYSGKTMTVLSKISRIWYFILLLGIVQSVLYQFGILISYESIFEHAPQNVSNIFGTLFIRPNTLFGEPRNFASLLFPIFYMYKFCHGQNKLSKIDYLLILILGFLTNSVTFYIFLVAFIAFYIFIFRFNTSSSIFSYNKFIIILLLVSIMPLFIANIEMMFPRVYNYFYLIKTSTFTSQGDLFLQASDLFVIPYLYDIVTMKIHPLNALFGNGLGSFVYVLNDYFISWFNTDIIEESVRTGSRILVFTILVETGIIGLILFLFIFIKIYYMVDSLNTFNVEKKSMLKLVVASAFIGGIINASFIFVVPYMYVVYLHFQERFSFHSRAFSTVVIN